MANVSVLNTTNQLSGKTIAVCENDQTISGAWTFTGNQSFTGNVTLGNASGDTVTITGTITSNLIFTDATYDIGASGATRPRDLFLSRNATIGGTLAASGAVTLASDSAGTVTIGGGATASELRLKEPSGSGSNYTAFKAQAQAGDVTYTLPAADGSSGYALTTNGSGTLSWASPGVMTLLKANSGTTTNSGTENVDTVSISGLTAKDTLIIYASAESVTQQTANLRLYSDSDVIINFGTVSTASTINMLTYTLRNSVHIGNTSIEAYILGRENGTGSVVGTSARATMTTAWTGSWTLALNHGGVTAGGTFRWNWAVYKIAGQ